MSKGEGADQRLIVRTALTEHSLRVPHVREWILYSGQTAMIDINKHGVVKISEEAFEWLMEQAGFQEVVVPRD